MGGNARARPPFRLRKQLEGDKGCGGFCDLGFSYGHLLQRCSCIHLKLKAPILSMGLAAVAILDLLAL